MLSPQLVVLWAAVFNFVAFAVFGLHVATTVGTGIIDSSVADRQGSQHRSALSANRLFGLR